MKIYFDYEREALMSEEEAGESVKQDILNDNKEEIK